MTLAALLRRVGAMLAVVALLLVATRARAQPPEMQAQSDTDVVGLGDVIHVTMQVTSYGGMPADPGLGANANFSIVSLTPSTSTQFTIANGATSSQRIYTALWTLKATKVGNAVVGPFTIKVDGTRYSIGALRVRVVPPGQAPPRPAQRSPFGSPFGNDPFASFFNNPFGQLPQLPPQAQESARVPTDPRLALDAPRDNDFFLHAVLDKTSAVVGEQVTLSVYLYHDVDSVRRLPEITDMHEPSASEFSRQQLEKEQSAMQQVGYASIAGRTYQVELARKIALFPLATGDLPVGAMRVQFGSKAANLRTSEELSVHVTEPPVAGRPAGYVVGDVGTFRLDAELLVEKNKSVEREGAVGVNVTVSGTGNVPASLTPPERAGVEWLDPQTNETLGPQPNGSWGGSRTFRYVVRLHRAGDVDLGDFTLPYWDPHSSSYAVAHVALGTVHVTPGAVASAASAEAPIDPLPGLPPLRPSLAAGGASARAHADDSPFFWIALAAMPLAYFGAAGAVTTVRRARDRRAAKAASPREDLRARVAAAEAVSRDGSARAGAVDAATIRVLEAATIAHRSVNVRALSVNEVARALTAAGAKDEDAREIEELLRACEASRYSASDDDASGARERWTRARGAIERLTRSS